MTNPCHLPAGAAGLSTPQVSAGLNLWLKLKQDVDHLALLEGLIKRQPQISRALTDLHYVHFARFVPSPDLRVLQVITAFDGNFDAYVLDFALTIGETFEFILGFVEGRPASPVIDHPAEFLKFIDENNRSLGEGGGGGIDLYSAYPDLTVIDIIGASGMAPAAVHPKVVAVDRSDVQANVLRSVNAGRAWHAGLRFGPGHSAHGLIRELVDGSNGAPRLSSDASRAEGQTRPPYWLTLGFSHAGLVRLGIGPADQRAFELAHRAFCRGPAEFIAAKANGDHGASDPAYWELGNDYPVDMLASLYADDEEVLAQTVAALLSRCTAHGVALVNKAWPAQAMVDDAQPGRHYVHFGYADGLSQPRLAIKGARDAAPDMQPRAGVGEFLLGTKYPNVFGGKGSIEGLSPALAQNATFAALRIMAQDVVGFERALDEASARHGVDREWLAAKLMGRWRDGTPLSQSPEEMLAEPGAPARNHFDYLPSVDHPSTLDDSAGKRCPIGAHARRMNPRSARVAGRPHSRRLLRRGMPYGPAFVPGQGDDGQPRGLIGLFLCADLDRQYEFLLREWAQGDAATSGIRGERDPILGTPQVSGTGQPGCNRFSIPRPDGQAAIVLELPQLVTTVGSVYLFMPGLGGMRYLAGLGAQPAAAGLANFKALAPAAGFASTFHHTPEAPPAAQGLADPASFDPTLKSFRDDPIPTYAAFRTAYPVARIASTASTWVFSHAAVAEIAGNPARFHRREAGDEGSAGLLNMDPPAHPSCRMDVGPRFDGALAALAADLPAIVRQQYASACQGKGQQQPVDWVAGFARPVARQAFFRLFGLAQDDAVIKPVEESLAIASPKQDAQLSARLAKLRKDCALALNGLKGQRVPGRAFDALLAMTRLHDPVSNKPYKVFGIEILSALEVEQLANATTLAMAGILPLQWFIALAAWRLLQDGGTLLQQLKANPDITDRAVVDELLRFDVSTPMADRYAAQDGTLQAGEWQYRAGERFTLAFASANRDEAWFGADADRINFRRTQNPGPGLALGATGLRHCLGSGLVYQLMGPVIQTLRTANPVPRLQAGFSPVWGKGALFRPMMKLPVHS